MAADTKGVNAHLISKTVADLIDRLVESTELKNRLAAEEVSDAMQGLWRKAMHEYDFLPQNLDLVPYAEMHLEPKSLLISSFSVLELKHNVEVHF
jgi:hypothetical protein